MGEEGHVTGEKGDIAGEVGVAECGSEKGEKVQGHLVDREILTLGLVTVKYVTTPPSGV